MLLRKVKQTMAGLITPQKKRLAHSCKTLRTDRMVKIFDPITYLWLLRHDRTGFVQREKEYLDSIGYAASQYDYEMIEQQISRFQEPGAEYKGWNKFFKRAVRDVTAELKCAKLKSLQYTCDKDVADAMPRKDTHAGFSFILTGMKKKGEYVVGIYAKLVEKIAQAKREGTFGTPIMIGSRTQASGAYDHNGNKTYKYKKKTRLVSMIDIFVVMAETIFAKPVQQYLSGVSWYAGGKSDPQLMSIIRPYVNRRYHMFTIDYSSYDQTIPAWIIYEAFDIVKAMFEGDKNFDEQLFDVIVHDFVHKVYIDGNGQLRYVDKGVPSGSMFTQIIDSIVNRLMVLTYCYAKDVEIEHMIIMGDDNLIITPSKLNEHELCSYLNYMFGVTAHPDKCIYTPPGEDPEFLSRYWKAAGCWRDPHVIVSKLLYPERFRDYQGNPDMNPELITYSYYLSFPLGVTEFLDSEVMLNIKMSKEKTKRAKDRHKWLSGLERFRAAYM